MNLDYTTIGIVVLLCAQPFAYCYYYQLTTGIPVLSHILNNDFSRERMLEVINTVNSILQNISTEVSLSDIDLGELLTYAIEASGNTNIVSVEVLQSLGLYTDSIIAYLNLFGYLIQ